MVFHGDISDSYEYFASKGYILPPGENIADWLIDIASGLGTLDKRASGGKLLRDSSSLIQMSFDDVEEESSIQYPRSSITSTPNRFEIVTTCARVQFSTPDHRFEIVTSCAQVWLPLRVLPFVK